MYKLFLSLRYLRTRFLALASLLSITFGVAMLLIVLSVMGGYMEQVRENIRGQESHLRLLGRGPFGVRNFPRLEEALLSVPNVAAVAPFIDRLAIYKSGIAYKPCQLQGIDARRQAALAGFGRYVLRPPELEAWLERWLPPPIDPSDPQALELVQPEVDVSGAMRALHEQLHPDSGREALSGEELEELFGYAWRQQVLEEKSPHIASSLDAAPPAVLVGAQLLIDQQLFLGQVVPVLTLDPRSSEPLSQNFIVVGAYKTGDFALDSGTLMADVKRLRNMLHLKSDPSQGSFRYQGVRIALSDPEQLEESRLAVEAVIDRISPSLTVRTWQELRQNMLRAVLIEKAIVSTIVFFLVLFTAAMVLLMLILTVIEKMRDIGVLMALGATSGGVTTIFLINGVVVSVCGTLLGLGLGFLFCSWINEIHDAIHRLTGWQLFPPEIYQLDRIPVAFQPLDIVLCAVVPVLFGLLASLLPALWAPRRDPIKTIQYE